MGVVIHSTPIVCKVVNAQEQETKRLKKVECFSKSLLYDRKYQ